MEEEFHHQKLLYLSADQLRFEAAKLRVLYNNQKQLCTDLHSLYEKEKRKVENIKRYLDIWVLISVVAVSVAGVAFAVAWACSRG